MNIIVSFKDGTSEWQDRIKANAAIASTILSDPDFIAKVRAFPKFDDTDQTPDQVANTILNAGDVNITVGFYWSCFTKAIAFEENGEVDFNTDKAKYGAGSPGNCAHETMHALGFQHNGNSPNGNQNTVPWKIGTMVDATA